MTTADSAIDASDVGGEEMRVLGELYATVIAGTVSVVPTDEATLIERFLASSPEAIVHRSVVEALSSAVYRAACAAAGQSRPLAGAALLDVDFSGRRGIELPKVKSIYWPHGANFDREGNIFVVEWVEIGRVTKLRKVS